MYANFQVSCKLKMNSEGLSYKVHKASKSEVIPVDEIDVANWQRLATGFGIRIFTSNGDLHRFGGFKDTVRDFIAILNLLVFSSD